MRLDIQKKHRFVEENYNYHFEYDEFDVAMGHPGKEVVGLELRIEIWLKEVDTHAGDFMRW